MTTARRSRASSRIWTWQNTYQPPSPLSGLILDEVAEVLEAEGIRKFVEPFDALLDALRRHARAA